MDFFEFKYVAEIPCEGEGYWRVEADCINNNCVQFIYFQYPVIKQTPKGVWIRSSGRERFILNTSRKKWAYPTKEGAFASFKIRMQRRREHWQEAGARLDAIEKLMKELEG